MRRAAERGVTILEMLLVVTIIALAAAVVYPSVGAGLDGMALNAATNEVVQLLNEALNRAERKQQVVEVVIDPRQGTLAVRNADGRESREVRLPGGVKIAAVLPLQEGDQRHVVLVPGGVVPRIAVDLISQRGAKRRVAVDAATGAPQISVPGQGEEAAR